MTGEEKLIKHLQDEIVELKEKIVELQTLLDSKDNIIVELNKENKKNKTILNKNGGLVGYKVVCSNFQYIDTNGIISVLPSETIIITNENHIEDIKESLGKLTTGKYIADEGMIEKVELFIDDNHDS